MNDRPRPTEDHLERRLDALAAADRASAPPELEDSLVRAALAEDRRPSVIFRLAPLLAAAAAIAVALPLLLPGAPAPEPEAVLVEYELETAFEDDWLAADDLDDISDELTALSRELGDPFDLTDAHFLTIGDES